MGEDLGTGSLRREDQDDELLHGRCDGAVSGPEGDELLHGRCGGTVASAAEHACAALLPQTASSRDTCAAVAARSGVVALLSACAGGVGHGAQGCSGTSPHSFLDLLLAFRDEGGAVPLLLQLVSLGTPRAHEQAPRCLQSHTVGDGDEAQWLKVEANALACVRDFLDGRGDGDDEPPGLAPVLGLLRNMASFWYIAEIAASSGCSFVAHVVAALGSDRSATRTEAALAFAELCGNVGSSKAARRRQHEAAAGVDAGGSMRPRLVRVLAAVLGASSGYRKAFRKDERGMVNAVQLLGPGELFLSRCLSM